MKSNFSFVIFLLLLPLSAFAQRNLGNFSFGTVHQVHSQFTAKHGKIFALVFKIIPIDSTVQILSYDIKFPDMNTLIIRNHKIEKIGGNLVLVSEILNNTNTQLRKIEFINGILKCEINRTKNSSQIITSETIPFVLKLTSR